MRHQEAGDHGVERAVLERQRPGVGVLEPHLRVQARGQLEHLGREVDPDDVAAALGRSGGGVARARWRRRGPPAPSDTAAASSSAGIAREVIVPSPW